MVPKGSADGGTAWMEREVETESKDSGTGDATSRVFLRLLLLVYPFREGTTEPSLLCWPGIGLGFKAYNCLSLQDDHGGDDHGHAPYYTGARVGAA
jgi:hypothetical protein